MDGVWDCFHKGHVKHFQQVKNLDGEYNTVIVGIVSDSDAAAYKRQPVYDREHRSILVQACRYVDEVVSPAPLVITKEFLDLHRIDLVCHAFSDMHDAGKQDAFFRVPRQLGLFRALEYNRGVSTTAIIEAREASCKLKSRP